MSLPDLAGGNLAQEAAAFGLILDANTNALVKAGIFTYITGYKET